MLVGQFNDSFPPITDGVATLVRNYAHWITRAPGGDHRCIVVTPDAPGHSDASEIFEVIRYASLPFPLRPPYRFGMPHLDPHLLLRLRAIPFDLIHAHAPFSAGQIARGLARRRGIPLVATFHSKLRDDILPIVRSEALADVLVGEVVRFYESADAVWTVNEASAGTLREYGYRGPITVVRNGTDLPAADPAHRRSGACEAACRSLGIAERDPVFLYVGQHVWQKNVRLLLDALALLKAAMSRRDREGSPAGRPAFRMLFAGGGAAEEEMKRLAAELGLSNETRFLGVVRDRTMLRGLYERADLLLFPSVYDMSSLVMREAASALCPTVAIAGSNTAEGILDGENGFLSEETPQAFADRVLRALDDPEGVRRAGLGAQRDFHRTWAEIAAQAVGEYEDVIERYRFWNR